METYTKIEAIFERDNITKKTIKGQYWNKTVELLKDIQWFGTEKIDGINIRIHWDGYRVAISGRNDDAQITPKLLEYLQETFNCHELFEQKFGEKEVTLFGEGYGRKVNGNYLNKEDNGFILFDIYSQGIYWNRKAVESIATYFNIPIVPIVKIGTLDEMVEMVENGFNSKLNPDVLAEGIVAKPTEELRTNNGNRVITKIKYRDLHEKKARVKTNEHN